MRPPRTSSTPSLQRPKATLPLPPDVLAVVRAEERGSVAARTGATESNWSGHSELLPFLDRRQEQSLPTVLAAPTDVEVGSAGPGFRAEPGEPPRDGLVPA